MLRQLLADEWRFLTFRNVLLFVTLTSPPALLYAVPVERFLSMDSARSTNAWFLGVVALWRVALYSTFLRWVAGLRRGSLVIGTLLPLVFRRHPGDLESGACGLRADERNP